MDEIIYMVRKHGAAHVSSKAAALRVINAAKAQGYNFGTRYSFAGWFVTDLDD